jgi:hypothetical protein
MTHAFNQDLEDIRALKPEHPALTRIVLMARFGGELCDRKKDNEAEAFIINAVNNHAALVKALKDLENAIVGMKIDHKEKFEQAYFENELKAARAAHRAATKGVQP